MDRPEQQAVHFYRVHCDKIDHNLFTLIYNYYNQECLSPQRQEKECLTCGQPDCGKYLLMVDITPFKLLLRKFLGSINFMQSAGQ